MILEIYVKLTGDMAQQKETQQKIESQIHNLSGEGKLLILDFHTGEEEIV